MTKYINAEALLVFLDASRLKANGFRADVHNAALESVADYVKKIPAENVAPVRCGEWLRYYCDDGNPDGYECNQCKEWYVFDRLPNYCPECGAKMEDTKQEGIR